MNAKRKVLLPVVFVIALALIFSFAAFTLTACGDKEPTVTSIEISETLTVEAGMSVTPTVTITYSDGNTSTRTADIDEWVSSAPTIASVSAIGRVRGEAKGTAEITAKVGDVTSNVCTVTVTAGREVSILKDGQPITELTLDKEDDAAGVTLTAKVTREGTEVPDQEIEWESSDATKVTVANGLITPVLDTEEGSPVTVTAKIAGTNFSASIPVTVTWNNKGNYTFDASTYEQNKSPAGIWNYWGDKNYNWTNTTITTAYVDGNYENGKAADSDYIYIGAQKVTIQYKVDDPNANHAAVQLFYRSAGQDGKLQTNHNYEVKLKIESNVSGTVSLNDFRDVPSGAAAIGVEAGEITDGKEDSDYEKAITANEVNEISVQFRHGDSGEIYANGVYDNIESAIQLCIGKLAGDVTLSVYDIQYKDLGEATKKFQDNPEKLASYVDPDAPTLPEVPAEVKPVGAITPTGARIVAGTEELDGKALFEITGTIDTATYFEGDDNAANEWLKACWFDAQESGGGWALFRFTVVSSKVESGAFTIQYDITRLKPIVGADSPAYSCHFVEKEASEAGYNDNHYRDLKLTTEQASHGQTITVGTKKYTLYNEQISEQAHNWGCVAILVENVEAE